MDKDALERQFHLCGDKIASDGFIKKQEQREMVRAVAARGPGLTGLAPRSGKLSLSTEFQCVLQASFGNAAGSRLYATTAVVAVSCGLARFHDTVVIIRIDMKIEGAQRFPVPTLAPGR